MGDVRTKRSTGRVDSVMMRRRRRRRMWDVEMIYCGSICRFTYNQKPGSLVSSVCDPIFGWRSLFNCDE